MSESLVLGWSGAADDHPYYLPDGCGLLFDSNRGGTPRLYLMRPPDTTVVPLGPDTMPPIWATVAWRDRP